MAAFKKYGNFGELLRKGQVEPIFEIFKRYLERRDERLRQAKEWIKKPQDFTAAEEINLRNLDYPENDLEVGEIVRKRVKYDLMVLKANGPRGGRQGETAQTLSLAVSGPQ